MRRVSYSLLNALLLLALIFALCVSVKVLVVLLLWRMRLSMVFSRHLNRKVFNYLLRKLVAGFFRIIINGPRAELKLEEFCTNNIRYIFNGKKATVISLIQES